MQGGQGKGAKGGSAVGADQAAGLVEGKVVGKVGADEVGGELAATFAEDTGQAFGCQQAEGGGEVEVGACGGAFDQAGAGSGPVVAVRCGGVWPVQQPDGVFPGALAEGAGGAVGQAAVEEEAERLARGPEAADGQGGVIGAGGAGADEDGVMGQAQQVDMGAGLGPVIQRLSPVAVAMRPSSVVASFSVRCGRPQVTRFRKPALRRVASAAGRLR